MKRFAIFAAAWLALGLASTGGCDDDPAPSDDDDGGSSSSAVGSGSSGQGGGSSGSGGSSSGSGGSAPAISVCHAPCNSAADCDLGAAYLDADNHDCDQGACVYTGCVSDTECQTVGNYVCYQPTLGPPYCTPACTSPGDCDVGSGAAYDADNYSCDQGACVYTGCNSDSECLALGNYVCSDISGGVAYCQSACNTAADCDLGGGGAYDEDNYSCDAGVCRYQGCNSDVECQMSFADYVCR